MVKMTRQIGEGRERKGKGKEKEQEPFTEYP